MKQEQENDGDITGGDMSRSIIHSEADKIMNISYDDMHKIYKYKLKRLQNDFYLKPWFEKFWNLITHNYKNEIEKQEFISLFTKIYRVILPTFNYSEIPAFLDSEWALITKK